MKLFQRIKNVFTDTLVEKLNIVELDPKEDLVYSVHIDWNLLGKPFSIERNKDVNGESVTIIGYWIENVLEPKQWYLYINKDQHEELVNQFKLL